MLVLAIIIYVVMALLTGPLWPLELLFGRAGPLGILAAIGWFALLIGGLNS